MSDYTLYWEAQSGAFAPQVMLEEMAADYVVVPVDMASGEHRSPGYLAVNPTGQVPALGLPGGVVIGESAAMVLVLGERHPEGGLVPGSSDGDHPIFLRWLLFMAASVYMTFVRSNHPERFTTDETGIEGVRRAALRDATRYFDMLDDAIEGSPYFLGSGYGALDIYLAMLTIWHPDREALHVRNRKVGALCRAVTRRPVVARVLNEHGVAGL
jgi:glutathione S-transferase